MYQVLLTEFEQAHCPDTTRGSRRTYCPRRSIHSKRITKATYASQRFLHTPAVRRLGSHQRGAYDRMQELFRPSAHRHSLTAPRHLTFQLSPGAQCQLSASSQFTNLHGEPGHSHHTCPRHPTTIKPLLLTHQISDPISSALAPSHSLLQILPSLLYSLHVLTLHALTPHILSLLIL